MWICRHCELRTVANTLSKIHHTIGACFEALEQPPSGRTERPLLGVRNDERHGETLIYRFPGRKPQPDEPARRDPPDVPGTPEAAGPPSVNIRQPR